jgi:hypothetical protein
VERSAVSAVLSRKCFSTERTRISYFALLATSTCAALGRESRMQVINATGLDRKIRGSAVQLSAVSFRPAPSYPPSAQKPHFQS